MKLSAVCLFPVKFLGYHSTFRYHANIDDDLTDDIATLHKVHRDSKPSMFVRLPLYQQGAIARKLRQATVSLRRALSFKKRNRSSPGCGEASVDEELVQWTRVCSAWEHVTVQQHTHIHTP